MAIGLPPARAAAGSGDGARPVPLRTFESVQRAIQLFYPDGWVVTQHPDRSPYVVTARKTQAVDGGAAQPQAVIELLKYFHASATLGLDASGTGEQLVERYFSILRTAGWRVDEQGPLTVQGVRGRMAVMHGDAPGGTLFEMVVAVAAKGDTLAALQCQAPTTEFWAYRDLCQEVARRVEPFSFDPVTADNVLLDDETASLETEGVEALEAGEVDVFMERFEQAKRVNPGNAKHPLRYGRLLLTLADEATLEFRAILLRQSEMELQEALRLAGFQTDANAMAPVKSETLYLLGGVAERRGDVDQARALLEQAVQCYPLPQAQAAIARFDVPQ